MDMDRETKKKFIVAGIIAVILVIVAIISRSVLPLIPIFSAIGGFLIIIFGWEFGMAKHYMKVVYVLVLANIIVMAIFILQKCDSTPNINQTTTEQEGTSPAETTTEETTTEEVSSKKEKPSKEKPSKEETTEKQTTESSIPTVGIPENTTASEYTTVPEHETQITTVEKTTEKQPVETTSKKKVSKPKEETTKKKPSKEETTEKQTTSKKVEATTSKKEEITEPMISPSNPYEEDTTKKKKPPKEETTEKQTTEEYTTEEQTTEEQITEIAPQIDVNISHTVGAANANALVRVLSGKLDNINFVVRVDCKTIPSSSFDVCKNNDGTYSLKVPVNVDNYIIHIVVRDGADEICIQTGLLNY